MNQKQRNFLVEEIKQACGRRRSALHTQMLEALPKRVHLALLDNKRGEQGYYNGYSAKTEYLWDLVREGKIKLATTEAEFRKFDGNFHDGHLYIKKANRKAEKAQLKANLAQDASDKALKKIEQETVRVIMLGDDAEALDVLKNALKQIEGVK